MRMSGRVDILVVGGGIHGVAVAQAAAAAGYSVLLLEQFEQLAQGTSSRSSKLVHGGLRYLESGQFHLVRECLKERALLLKNAPELVRLTPFFIPVYHDTSRSPGLLRVGLGLYRLLAGLRAETRFRSLPMSAWEGLDGLATRELRAVFQYYDAQTDDALLTRAVMRSAARLGAACLTGARVMAIQRDKAGCLIDYERGGRVERQRADVVVNAAGPWANALLETAAPSARRLPVDLVQGAHIALAAPAPQGVYYVEAPQDRRAVFIMPWQGMTLVGTTETPRSALPAELADWEPLPAEIDYLRSVYRRYFPERAGAAVHHAFAGLRVLPKGAGSAFARPRETVLLWDSRMRILTVYGGKLTAYRATAEKVIRSLRAHLPRRRGIADTAQVRLEP